MPAKSTTEVEQRFCSGHPCSSTHGTVLGYHGSFQIQPSTDPTIWGHNQGVEGAKDEKDTKNAKDEKDAGSSPLSGPLLDHYTWNVS